MNYLKQYWPITNGYNNCFFAALSAYMYFSIDGDDCSSKIAEIINTYTKGPTIEDIHRQLREIEILLNISEIAFTKMETSPLECNEKIHLYAQEFRSISIKYHNGNFIDADVLGERKNYTYYFENGNENGYSAKSQYYNPDQLYLQLIHNNDHFYCLIIYDNLCYKIDSLNRNIIIRTLDELKDSETIILSTLYNRFDRKCDLEKYKYKYITPIMNKLQRYSCICN